MGMNLTEKEKSALLRMYRHDGWSDLEFGLSAHVCASFCRKGLARRMIHSEHVHNEKRVKWTLYRITDAGIALMMPNVQIEGQPAVWLSRSNAWLGTEDGK